MASAALVLAAALALPSLGSAEGAARADRGNTAAAHSASRRHSPQAPIPAKVHRYARRLVQQYDRNLDGKLQQEEWRHMQGQPARVDADGDGVITPDELAQWIAAYGEHRKLRLAYPLLATEATQEASTPETPVAEPPVASAAAVPTVAARPTEEREKEPSREPVRTAEQPSPTGAEPKPPGARFHVSAKRLPAGLPDWFLRRDTDGDGQLSLSEFAPKATAAERQEFARYDLNGDGLMTPGEVIRATKPRGSSKPSAKR